MTPSSFGPVTDPSGRVLDQVRLEGLEARGYHGVFEHEKTEGQTFRADVVLHLDSRPAARSDELDQAVDYSVLAEKVVAVLTGAPADLVETVAERIAAVALENLAVQAVDVAVHKPHAPMLLAFSDIVVAVRRDRAHPPVVAADAHLERRSPVSPEGPMEVPSLEPISVEGGLGEHGVVPLATPAAAPVVGAPPVVVPPVPAPALAPELPSPPASAPVGTPVWAPVEASAEEASLEEGEDSPVDEDTVPASSGEERELDRLDERPAEPAEVVLALGSNLGSSQDVLRSAVAALAAVPGLEVHEVSPLARTSAVGGPAGQPDFLNAVVLARTTLAPRELLLAVQEIENEHGRVREERWGPRTLDIDIIQFENVIAFSEDLELPHPRAHERAFVLQPWAELDPQAVLAGLGGGPVEALAATAPDKDGLRWMALDWLSPRES